MSRRSKELAVNAAPSAPSNARRPAKILRALAQGLFGPKKKYHPTTQEIADYYLTPSERQVAYLAALGFSDTEIADALGMTFQTARAHLRRVLTKMELADARALCDYFLEHSPPDP
ncbi:MAG: hypothetical protein HDKAJFGB_02922 [Anaerolineae bacterium]|nr:hypothetical protein [Anaerolineae bacterium]